MLNLRRQVFCMKKLGVIRCQQTEDMCPGTRDFATAKEGSGSLAESGIGACEIVGFVSCGGCPGKRAVTRAQMLRDRGAEVIMLASCIGKGTPIGFPCPNKGLMIKGIKAKLGEDFPVLDYSHEPSGKKC